MSTDAPPPRVFGIGRTFVGPTFDLLLIGGGLSFPIAAWIAWNGASAAAVIGLSIPVIALLVNQAHFAASTVRLYTKPGAFQSMPILTMLLPLLTLLVLSGAVAFAGDVGRQLWALSLTWSPFHYAAQTFGLASMYCYRSGCRLSDVERRCLRAVCLLPFFKAFLSGAGAGYGLGWLVPAAEIAQVPALLVLYQLTRWFLDAASLLAPLALFAWLARRRSSSPSANDPTPQRRPGMPAVSLLIMLSNAMWFVFFDYLDAFVWATVFHGVQYLAIVCIFHTQDQMRAPDNHRSRTYHVLWFYLVCVALGYGLFNCWPYAYTLAGFGMVESMLMVIGVINIHHFVVDAYIWRLRKDRNYQTVIGTTAG